MRKVIKFKFELVENWICQSHLQLHVLMETGIFFRVQEVCAEYLCQSLACSVIIHKKEREKKVTARVCSNSES